MKLNDFASNFATYICQHVFDKEREVAFVFIEEPCDLVMMCAGEHDWNVDRVRVVGLGHLLDRHPALGNLNLNAGEEAEKCGSGQWHTRPMANHDSSGENQEENK